MLQAGRAVPARSGRSISCRAGPRRCLGVCFEGVSPGPGVSRRSARRWPAARSRRRIRTSCAWRVTLGLARWGRLASAECSPSRRRILHAVGWRGPRPQAWLVRHRPAARCCKVPCCADACNVSEREPAARRAQSASRQHLVRDPRPRREAGRTRRNGAGDHLVPKPDPVTARTKVSDPGGQRRRDFDTPPRGPGRRSGHQKSWAEGGRGRRCPTPHSRPVNRIRPDARGRTSHSESGGRFRHPTASG